MAFQVSPGVLTVENNYTNIIPGIATSIGAIAGAFSWGPVEKIVTVTDENDLVSKFGKPDDVTYLTFFNAANYLSYSTHLETVRVVGENARNAISGGKGTGLKLDLTTINGEISSVVITSGQAGTNYQIGDLVYPVGGITKATYKVTNVNESGAVTGLEVIDSGSGYTTSSAVLTTTQIAVLVKNTDDFENSTALPEIVAKYPGILGNSLMVSIARASEFDNWEYANRFITSPAATVEAWDTDGKTNTFNLSNGFPSGGIVTVDGVKYEAGSNPGNYSTTSNTLTILTDNEPFVANGSTAEFTLANSDNIAVNGYKVVVGSVEYPIYDGESDTVPYGKVRVKGNKVTFGLNRLKFNGNGITTKFVDVGRVGVANQIIKLDGVTKTKVSVAPANANEVKVEEVAGNTEYTFFTAPGIGAGNIDITWGYLPNTTTVSVTYGYPSSGKKKVKLFSNQTEVHVIVADYSGKWTGEEGAILERYDSLSLIPGEIFFDGSAKYYETALNRRSQYIRIGSPLLSFGDKVLSGGVDDNVFGDEDGVTPGILQNGYSLFKNSEQVEVYHVILSDFRPSTALYVIQNIAEYTRDRVAYISPRFTDVVNNKGNEADAAIDYKNMLVSSSYYHIDSNWMYRYDNYNDKFRWIPCNGAAAGCYALTHGLFDAWISGAGLNRGKIKNAVKLAWNPSKTERDKLYKNNINPITTFLSEGPVLYGDKTGEAKPSAFDRMNVRFLFIVLEKAIAKAAKYYLFEQNDEFTRNRFKNMIIPFLRTVKGRRGVDEYQVKCDGQNNTQDIVSRNEFVADIYVRPVYSINFMQLNFNAVNGSVTFEEIINSNQG